jgi:hypothetical protein|tara:strand:- start:522 stop:761 length:240 start_codon:yes stop_codon:yes gene_type:complete
MPGHYGGNGKGKGKGKMGGKKKTMPVKPAPRRSGKSVAKVFGKAFEPDEAKIIKKAKSDPSFGKKILKGLITGLTFGLK